MARKIAASIVRTPISIAPSPLSSNALAWLSPYLYVSKSDQERIRVGIVEPTGRIRGLNEDCSFVPSWYTKTFGYSVFA